MYRAKRVLIYVILPLSILLFLALSSYVFGIRLNLSSSMPMGLYYADEQNITVGSIVSVCLPKGIAQEGIEKGYIAQTGFCDSNYEPVIKEIIGLPNDTVSIGSKYIDVIKNNGEVSKYFAPHHRFSLTNHAVKSFIKLGKQKQKGYWLYGVGNQNWSWDSRYFGAVQKSNILSVMKPLWIWSKD